MKNKKVFKEPKLYIIELLKEDISLAPSPGTFHDGPHFVDFDNDEFIY